MILIIRYAAFQFSLGPINHSRTRLAATNAWMAFLYGLGPELVKVGDSDSDGLTSYNVELNLTTDYLPTSLWISRMPTRSSSPLCGLWLQMNLNIFAILY